jgi:hypothetical protein
MNLDPKKCLSNWSRKFQHHKIIASNKGMSQPVAMNLPQRKSPADDACDPADDMGNHRGLPCSSKSTKLTHRTNFSTK